MLIDPKDLFLIPPQVEKDARFDRILKSCFDHPLAKKTFIGPSQPYWQASAFSLDRVQAFRELSEQDQSKVLYRCGEDLLKEACFIEMAGLSYTARMSLESRHLEERLFYSMMAAEEATHFSLLRPFVAHSSLAEGPDQFTALIGEMISEADREQVIFLVQVLLEGWGLSHFSWMASHCDNHDLKSVFKIILKDEARHHAAGLTLAKATIKKGDKKVIGWLESILAMVQVGPVRLLEALQNVTGRLSPSELSTTLLSLDAKASTHERLLRLRGLLSQHVEANLIQKFEEKGLFESQV